MLDSFPVGMSYSNGRIVNLRIIIASTHFRQTMHYNAHLTLYEIKFKYSKCTHTQIYEKERERAVGNIELLFNGV